MKKMLSILSFVTLLSAGPVYAQTVVPAAEVSAVDAAPAAAPVAAPAVEEAPVSESADDVSVGDVIGAGKTVYSDWKAIGWLAGLVALINFLMMLLRFGPMGKLITAKELQWAKPYIAGVLGGLLAAFTAVQSGQTWVSAAVVGVMAGFAAVGTHQAAFAKKRQTAAKSE